MSRDPWTTTVWTERQAAWWLAKLPDFEYEAWKVEGELEDAYPHSSPPTIPPGTKEGEAAVECLEAMRKAVRWRRLHPAGDQVMYWNGRMFVWANVDDMPANAEPVRFRIDVSELLRWNECKEWPTGTALAHSCGAVRGKPANASTGPNDAFYVAAIRLAWAGGAPRTMPELVKALQKSKIAGLLSEKPLRRAVGTAAAGGEIDYPAKLKGSAAKAALAMFVYAAECHGAQIEEAEPKQKRRVLAELLRAHGLPSPRNQAQWEAIGI